MSAESETRLPHLAAGKIVPLWVLVFFNGWFIMQTELAGARALTPYFGNSIFVWGSVIAVFLLALAIGYGLGGRLTRRYHSHWAPAALLIIAGLLVAVSVSYQDGLSSWLAGGALDVRWGVLIASILLYGLPILLSGTISPYSVHLATSARAEAGSRAGTLYAVSTVGSFIGSLATSFILVPSYSLAVVLFGAGVLAVLTAIVTGFCLSWSAKPAVVVSTAFTAVALIAGLYAPQRLQPAQQQVYSMTLVGQKLSDADPSTLNTRLALAQKQALRELAKYEKKSGEQVVLKIETAYHRVSVTQNGPVRMLTFGESRFKVPQTTMNLRNIKAHVAEYTQMMFAPILYKPNPKRVLIIGLGGGDIARGVETCYPNVEMDVVEIDPAVLRIALDYFFWKPSNKVTAYTMDGRSFLGLKIVTNAEPYDWIIIDAFDNDFVPFHMTTMEFQDIVQRVLSPDGVVAINTWINHALYSYQARTVKAAFGNLDLYFGHVSGNVIMVAQKGAKKPMTLERALEARKHANLAPGASIDLKYITSCLLHKPNYKEEGEVLTDTWAPVESLMK